jgi:hypothetical protein
MVRRVERELARRRAAGGAAPHAAQPFGGVVDPGAAEMGCRSSAAC